MIDVAILRAMASAGATVEMILVAVEAAQAVEVKRLAEKRAKDAARKRTSRMSRGQTRTDAESAGVTVTTCDRADPPSPPASPSMVSPNTPSLTTPSPSPSTTELRSADAPRDIRRDLFGKGLQTLGAITGKTPDSCRSLLGKWLKSANDEAIHVLAAIEDAERNRVADPVAWINRAILSKFTNGKPKRTVQDAAQDFLGKFGDMPAADGGTARGNPVRLLPSG